MPRGDYVDLYYKDSMWEEPIRLRKWRREAVPLTRQASQGELTKRAIAWLIAYHQANTQQLQRVLGVQPYTMSRLLPRLYEAKFVSRGRYNPYGEGAMPLIYRLNDSAELRAWVRDLSYEDWLGVTGGVKILYRGADHHRHNLLVNELVLFAAQYLPRIGCVLGEQFTEAKRMIPDCDSNAIGDAALVFDNGMRVVIELTSTLHQNIDAKMVRWGKVLASKDFNDQGLIVLFVGAAKQKLAGQVVNGLKRLADNNLTAEKLSDGNRWLTDLEVSRVRSMIHVVDWRSWFLPGGVPQADFYGLVTEFNPNNKRHWERTSIVNDWQFKPKKKDLWLAPMRQIDKVYAMPQILKDRHKDQ